MNESPPALTDSPQFSASYWRKVERLLNTAVIDRVTNLPVDDDGEVWVEIVIGNNMAFRRKKSEINQFLHANQKVLVENIGGKICTGLMVPDVGWAWRMTADDLASHSRELAAQSYRRAQEIRIAVLDFVTTAIKQNLEKQLDGILVDSADTEDLVQKVRDWFDVEELAATALVAMEAIGRQAAAA